MNKVKKIGITINDNQKRNLRDKVTSNNNSKDFQPKGRVKIYEQKIIGSDKKLYLVEDTSNLIVYRGRNWLLQRAFNQNMTNRLWKDRFISWIAIGTGGAVGGSPLVPTVPELPDCELGAQGTITNGRFVTVDGKEYHAIDEDYPRFLNDPDVENDDLCTGCTGTDAEDGGTYNCDKFLIGLVKCTLNSNEGNGGNEVGDYQDISEAGLYISPSNSLTHEFSSGDMELFARVTFSTIRKDLQRSLLLSWYIYF